MDRQRFSCFKSRIGPRSCRAAILPRTQARGCKQKTTGTEGAAEKSEWVGFVRSGRLESVSCVKILPGCRAASLVPVIALVRVFSVGLEPTTDGLEDRCAIIAPRKHVSNRSWQPGQPSFSQPEKVGKRGPGGWRSPFKSRSCKYDQMVRMAGLEPATPGSQNQRSSTELHPCKHLCATGASRTRASTGKGCTGTSATAVCCKVGEGIGRRPPRQINRTSE